MIDVGKQLRDAYDDGCWEMFCLITSIEYGKERFFVQGNGVVYDRSRHQYLPTKDEAINQYLSEISSY